MSELSDPNPELRRGAAFALGKIGADDADPRNVAEALTHSLRDKDAAVRDFAASGLGDLLTALNDRNRPFWAKTGAALQKALKEDDEPRVRRSAAFALGAFGAEAAPARDALIAASGDASPIVRQNAAWTLGKLGKEAGADGVERLRVLLQDDEPLVRRDALHALGEIGNPTAHPAVASMLRTAGTAGARPTPNPRWARQTPAVPGLIRPPCSRPIAESLARIGQPCCPCGKSSSGRGSAT